MNDITSKQIFFLLSSKFITRPLDVSFFYASEQKFNFFAYKNILSTKLNWNMKWAKCCYLAFAFERHGTVFVSSLERVKKEVKSGIRLLFSSRRHREYTKKSLQRFVLHCWRNLASPNQLYTWKDPFIDPSLMVA